MKTSPATAWRALPLTAQLSIVGMLVTIAWFLTARAASERQLAREGERLDELARVHNAELLVARVATSVEVMTAAYRGFVASGEPSFLDPFDVAERQFAGDLALLRLRALESGIREEDLLRLRDGIARWQAEGVRPVVAAIRAGGAARLRPGSEPFDRFMRGGAAVDDAREVLASMRSDARARVLAIQSSVEEASAMDDLEQLAIIAGAVLIFLLVGVLLLRVVKRALDQVITSAEALQAGRYEEARAPARLPAPNRELARLSRTFAHVADSLETRERQLQEDIEKLRELERLKTDFVSTVSHELRTPLTSMRGALGLIIGGKVGEVPPKARELMQIAMSNTERLIRLINDILDIEKMDAGHVAVRRDRLALRPLLETMLAGLEGLARDAKVSLTLEAPVEGEVIGDADRLVQVFTNLVSNAVKFSPAGSAVRLSLARGSGVLTVRVRDHGPGIPPEFADRIFGRFQQAGGAVSRKSGGTGLGLSIAKAITELHGGRIGFEPADGGGTVFWVELPLAPVITGEFDARRSVLIVEDDPGMRDVLVAQVEAFARPIAVPSAEAALELLGRDQVAAIVLDPGLPGMSGLEFARAIRADPRLRTMPVFLFSASEQDPEELRRAGIRAADVYVKSRDSEEVLFDRLKATIRNKPTPR